MRIAVSGTHFIGKSTLIEDFIKTHPQYKCESEPYYKLQEEKQIDVSLEPSLDFFLEQLEYSMAQLNEDANEQNIIFDRCPVDFLAYAMYILGQDSIDINNSEISEIFPDIKEALNHLDLIVFLPLTNKNSIDYTEENPAYRKAVDKYFKQIYQDGVCDIFPHYDHPEILEIYGDRLTRLKKLESYLI
jgi:hypothetical protein